MKLYFDNQSGLLLREVRFIKTVVGRNPLRSGLLRLSRYLGIQDAVPHGRDVDGRALKFDFSQYQLNTAIDAAKFSQPARPKPLQTENEAKP